MERLQTAATDESQPDEVYIALTEAANWLDSLDGRTDLGGNVDVQPVLFARTRAHHHSASIAYWDQKRKALLWRPASQLPRPKNERDSNAKRRPFYEERLEGKPVLDVFQRLRPIVGAASKS